MTISFGTVSVMIDYPFLWPVHFLVLGLEICPDAGIPSLQSSGSGLSSLAVLLAPSAKTGFGRFHAVSNQYLPAAPQPRPGRVLWLVLHLALADLAVAPAVLPDPGDPWAAREVPQPDQIPAPGGSRLWILSSNARSRSLTEGPPHMGQLQLSLEFFIIWLPQLAQTTNSRSWRISLAFLDDPPVRGRFCWTSRKRSESTTRGNSVVPVYRSSCRIRATMFLFQGWPVSRYGMG